MEPSIDAALEQWSRILPAAAVLTGTSLAHYRENCLGLARNIPAALQPRSEADVVGIVRIANSCRVPLYTISTGRNWGYGSALPVRDGCVILDLSLMNRILDMDAELGLVTLEPGVTQKQLFDYLESRNLNFFVPTTGAGPTASIVGNALERGFGMTPEEDHFRAITSIRAVLPNGAVYRSFMSEVGAEACGVLKWGVGPYLDGLFSQSNLGIVTSMQISLVQRPEHIEVYFFTLKKASEFHKLLHSCRNLLINLRGHVGSIKILNQRQVELSIGTRDIGSSLTADFAWMGFGVIRCPRSMIRGIRQEVRRALPDVSRLVFVNESRVKRMRLLQRFVPGKKGKMLKEQLDRLNQLLEFVTGIPRGRELNVVYQHVDPGALPLDPARDGVGVVWYAPVLPFKIELITRMTAMIVETLRKFGFDEAITVTTFNEVCAIGVIPIVYRRPDERSKAHDCFRELWKLGNQLGCHPYRMNIAAMPEMADAPNSTFWALAHDIKVAIDPNDILSPGRYSSSARERSTL